MTDQTLRVTFTNRLEGFQRMKSAQGTIKTLLKSDFSSYLIHFFAIIEGGGGSQRDLSVAARMPRVD